MSNWVTLGSGDRIKDVYEDDGTKTVEITYNGDTYTSTNSTIIEGAQDAKLAKAAGGSAITLEADLNTSTDEIEGIGYYLSG